MQEKLQVVLLLMQFGAELAGPAGHGVQEVPHELGELFDAHMPEQRCWLVAQVAATHVLPLQVVVAAGVGQSAHTPPHSREPVAQVIPQAVPLQVAVPFATVGHGVHDVVPQVAVAEFETQAPEHT